ncbi:hypothetical protein Tco_0808268 [Tanacetum coccineum]
MVRDESELGPLIVHEDLDGKYLWRPKEGRLYDMVNNSNKRLKHLTSTGKGIATKRHISSHNLHDNTTRIHTSAQGRLLDSDRILYSASISLFEINGQPRRRKTMPTFSPLGSDCVRLHIHDAVVADQIVVDQSVFSLFVKANSLYVFLKSGLVQIREMTRGKGHIKMVVLSFRCRQLDDRQTKCENFLRIIQDGITGPYLMYREADEQLRFCKSWLLNGCTRKRLKVVIFYTAKLHQSLDTKNVESSSVRLEGLCKSTLGSTVVSACLQQQGSVTSLVTGNVPVENALADSVKTQCDTEAINLILDDVSCNNRQFSEL